MRVHVCVCVHIYACMCIKCVCMCVSAYVCACVCVRVCARALACDLPVIDLVGLIDLVRVSSDTVLIVEASDILLVLSTASSTCMVSPSPYPTMSMGPRGEAFVPCPIDPFPASDVTTLP